MTRRAALLALVLLAAVPDGVRAQPGPTLREDPEDFWADVHRWTGSEATRPRGRRAAPAEVRGPDPEGRPTVRTSTTARANIRQEPSLDAPVIRRMPSGSRLVVFGTAPDGWFHVGDAAPFGWIHETALQR